MVVAVVAEMHAKEAKIQKKRLRKAVADETEVEAVAAKRLRKATKRAAAEAAAAESLEAELVEAKRLRKAAKHAAAAAAADAPEEDHAEAKKLRKAAKRAAAEAKAALPAEEDAKGESKKPEDEKLVVQENSKDVKEEELTVFVGGVPFRCDEATLRHDFETECGEIERMSMPLGDDGRPRGSAFITFKTRAGVDNALRYDGEEYGSRRLTVRIAGKIGERGRDRGDAELEVCLKGLENGVEDDKLRDEFAKCGGIASVRVPRWPDGGSKGTAFITFKTSEGLEKALELDGTPRGNWYLSVQRGGQNKGNKGNNQAEKGKGKDKGKSKGKDKGKNGKSNGKDGKGNAKNDG